MCSVILQVVPSPVTGPPLKPSELSDLRLLSLHSFAGKLLKRFILFLILFALKLLQGGVDQKMPLVVSRINPESPVSRHSLCYFLCLLSPKTNKFLFLGPIPGFCWDLVFV